MSFLQVRCDWAGVRMVGDGPTSLPATPSGILPTWNLLFPLPTPNTPVLSAAALARPSLGWKMNLGKG